MVILMDKKILRGAFIVTLGIILSKGLSLFFIFPFSKMVGSVGLALYTYAYTPFLLFLEASTLGIPLAVNKLVSKYPNKEGEINYFSFRTIMCLSVISFILLNLFSNVFAKHALGTGAVNTLSSVRITIFIISLSLFTAPLLSLVRCYFQGKKRFFLSSLSQVIEQGVRVSFILIFGYILIYKYNQTYEKAVYVAIFSTFISSLFALLFLYLFYRKRKYNKASKAISKEVLFTALPFLLSGLNITIYNIIDSLTYNNALNTYGLENPEYYYGIYSFEINRLICIPLSLAIGLSISLLPNLVEKKDKKLVSLSFRFLLLILIPVTFFSMAFSNEIYGLFYNHYDIGGNILLNYAPLIIMMGLQTLDHMVLQGLNRGKLLCISILIGIIIKGTTNYYFIINFGYNGAILSSFLALLISFLFSIFFNYKEIDLKVLFKDLFKILIKSFVCVWFVLFIKQFFTPEDDKLSLFFYLCFFSIFYFILYYFISKKMIKEVTNNNHH